MHIVQIVPFMSPGSGVAAVAWNLDREFRALGATVETFTFATARRGKPFPYPTTRWASHIARARRILWFSTVGTTRANRFLADRPDAVSICHNEVLAADIYVDHGATPLALKASGHSLWRRWRNPMIVFGVLRERVRYRGRVHHAVVTLSDRGLQDLKAAYGRVRPRVVEIPNGVALDQFRPPDAATRAAARAALQLDDEDRVALFVGHDLPRKGISPAIEALVHADTVLLLVVGGDALTIGAARAFAVERGVAERVLFVGPHTNLGVFLAAADMFVFPSGYEANALVILEALASGLPVISTPVGYAPQIIVDGVNGFLVSADGLEIARRLEEIAGGDRSAWGALARQSVLSHSWQYVAERYLELARELLAGRASVPTAHRPGPDETPK